MKANYIIKNVHRNYVVVLLQSRNSFFEKMISFIANSYLKHLFDLIF